MQIRLDEGTEAQKDAIVSHAFWRVLPNGSTEESPFPEAGSLYEDAYVLDRQVQGRYH